MITNKRNSSIELSKLLSMLMIIISHVAFTAKSNMYLTYLGSIGDCVFFACTAWYLCEDKEIGLHKIIRMIIDTFVISMLFFFLYKSVFGYNISVINTVRSFFPVFFENNWYVTCYIVFYMIHVLLNNLLANIDEQKLVNSIILLVLVYFGICTISAKLYANRCVYFIVFYFIMYYLKKYKMNYANDIKVNIKMCTFAIILLIVLILATYYVNSNITNKIELEKFNSINNPFVVIIGIAVFNIIRTRTFNNQIINFLSSCMIYVYLIHDNFLFREFSFNKIINVLSFTNNSFINIVLISIIVFLISTLLSTPYRWFSNKFISNLSQKISNVLINTINKISNFIIKY